MHSTNSPFLIVDLCGSLFIPRSFIKTRAVLSGNTFAWKIPKHRERSIALLNVISSNTLVILVKSGGTEASFVGVHRAHGRERWARIETFVILSVDFRLDALRNLSQTNKLTNSVSEYLSLRNYLLHSPSRVEVRSKLNVCLAVHAERNPLWIEQACVTESSEDGRLHTSLWHSPTLLKLSKQPEKNTILLQMLRAFESE